jgi:uncharacterized protein with HEPN domain
MRDDRYRLEDIFDALDRIDKYVIQGKPAFTEQELIQVWIIHHLQIIGEAASQLSKYYLESHPKIPWPQIIAMRNILINEHFIKTCEVR